MSKNTLLHINSSSRYGDSISRKISQAIVNAHLQDNASLQVTQRDVAKGLPFINEPWIEANFTDIDKRNQDQKQALSFSDGLVSELQQAETIVIGVPMYNFNVPATLKTWIDLVARAGLTFRYTEQGPIGLLNDKKVIIAIASGGVPIGSEMDLASPYLKLVLNFIGLSDVTIIDSSKIDLNVSDAELTDQIKQHVQG